MACVFVELGTDVHIDGSFEAAIHEGVRRGYTDGYLRKSIVADPLRRGNTGDNTPAAITVHLVDGEGCRITVAPKGFGSENMSRIQMLKPADGVEGFKKFVVDTVKLAGSNPCPPIVLGIGVGGSFDKVAYLQTLEVIAWPDLGCEAVRRLTVQDMPLTVVLDAHGGDLYETGPAAYLAAL